MPFKRVKVIKPIAQYANDPASDAATARWLCPACHNAHPIGSCPLKIAGVERCNLCGIAHYGQARACPHLNSEEKVRAMIEALKHSSESRHLVEYALKYLKGVKGHLVARNKRDAEKAPANMAMGLGSGPATGVETGVGANSHAVPPQPQLPSLSAQPQGGMYVNGLHGSAGVPHHSVSTDPHAVYNAQSTVSSLNNVATQENTATSTAAAAAGAAITGMAVPQGASANGGVGDSGGVGDQIRSTTYVPVPVFQR